MGLRIYQNFVTLAGQPAAVRSQQLSA